MKALITGAAGFIGSSLALRLSDEGHEVSIVDNLSTGRKEFVDELKSRVKNVLISDYGSDETRDLIHDEQFDVVFHIGAIPRVVYSVENPIDTHTNNVIMTLRLLESCKGNVGRIVFSSSSSIYGDDVKIPTVEDNKRTPKSPYAAQKSVCEDYMRMYNELYGLESVSLRYFNVYGPRQYGDSAYSTVISAWCQALHDNKVPRLDGDGTQSRDFCYIDNVLDANVLAATSDNPAILGTAYNVAHGDNHTLNQLYDMFAERFDGFSVVRAPERLGDVKHTRASLYMVNRDLGYNPTVSFKEGLERTWKWWGL